MESYVIKYNNISPLGVIPLDVMVNNMEKMNEGAAVVRDLDHLVYFKAIGAKESNHGVVLSTDGSALSNCILGALGLIVALVSEVGVKG